MSPGKIVLGTKYLNPQYAMLFLVTFIDLNIYKASIWVFHSFSSLPSELWQRVLVQTLWFVKRKVTKNFLFTHRLQHLLHYIYHTIY